MLTFHRKYFNKAQKINELCSLEINNDINLKELNKDFDKYKFITR